MKHKAKSFIAVLLALCLMMSLGVGALADGENSDEPSGGDTPGGDYSGGGDDSGTEDGGDENPDEGEPDPDGGDGDPAPLADETYTVDFGYVPGIIIPNITYAVEGGEGGKVTNHASIPSGATITVNVSAASGYRVGNITYKLGEGTETTIQNGNTFKLTANAIIMMHNVQLYDITCQQAANGSVTSSATEAAEGDTVTITATPAQGYEFGTLTVTANGSPVDTTSAGDNKHTFTMPASDVTVSATFKLIEQTEPDTHTVSTSGTNANITLTTGDGYYKVGDQVTFTVAPHSGYRISRVYATGATLADKGNGSYSFTMPNNNVVIYAEATAITPPADYHRISTYSNDAYGWVSVDETAKAGSTVYFRIAHTYSAYNYDYKVYVTNDRTGATVKYDYDAYYDRYSFTMPDDDVTISVYFDYAGRYSITKDVEGDGSIYVRSSADHGDTVWIEAAPNAGQSLTSLRVFYGEPWAYGDKGYYGYWDEAEVKYSTYWDAYYFTMPADDVVVYARFTDGATVDVITGDHGDAKVSSRYADKGDWVYITAYPDEGYEVDSVTVTDSLGRSVKVTELSYDYFLFTMPGTNVDVKVTFRVKDYDVFYDVSRGDWYYKAVRFVHEKGIMEGTGTHYFSPEADLSRGMLATILYRLEGSPAVSGYSGFADVADTAYYAKAVAWAKANGIVNGVTTTAYEPDTAVTREELAAILCRYAAFKGKDTAISYDYLAGFSDANTSHVYARPALNWAVAYDIINGQGNGVLAPRATATRAEVAQVLMNYLEVFD